MSFLFADTPFVAAAATDLAGIGTSISSASNAIATATTAVIPAGLDEVSASIAALFGAHGQAYQALSAQAALFHEEFVQAMSAGAQAYASAEALNVQAALASGPVGAALDVFGQAGANFATNVVNAELAFNGALVGGQNALVQAAGGINSAVGSVLTGGFNAANLVVGTGEQVINTVIGAQVPTSFASSLVVGGPGAGLQLSAALNGLAGNFNAALSGLGSQLSTVLSGSLALPDFSSLAANLNGALSGSFAGGLPNLSGLVQTGQSLAAGFNAAVNNLGAQVSGALAGLPDVSGLIQTGAALTGNFGATLNGLGAQLSAALGGGLPALAALAGNFGASLNGLGAQLSAALSGAFGGGLPGLAGLAGNVTAALNGLGGQLSAALSGGLPNLAALLPTGGTLIGNFNAALNGLGGQLSAALTGGLPGIPGLALGVDLPGLVASFTGALPGFGAQVNTALTAALAGNFGPFSALVNTVAAIPTNGVAQLNVLQNGILGGLATNELALSSALVANEQALVSALLGPAALTGAGGYAINAANLLLGTPVNVLNGALGLNVPGLTTSLLFNPAFAGGITGGGLLGAAEQLLSLNAAVGGLPGLDASLLTQLGLGPAGLDALVNSQLAFNGNLVANEEALRAALVGVVGPLNGAIDNAIGMVNGVVGGVQGVADGLLGASLTGFTTPLKAITESLIVPPLEGDLFGAITAGGFLGALENKFLMDASFISNFLVPIQLTLNGGLPAYLTQLGANINANLNAVLTGSVNIGPGGITVGGGTGGTVDTVGTL
ncbi:PE family protein [Mycobacterium kubicae]|uniref:PE family protein n=1 Tax=Mycobacterium kubicae TaxID=120959 RepID=A0AAX1J5I9_9MYCO|nr:PE family protein [Mycobacterium kubicae]MCV7096579.1 PE family protein [Mycobacterium kubicae]QNI13235.1 PE family protein [Mycobacterium kubicae]QPI36753.1 PE family protein [Mycobacterium kubicae]